MVTPSSTLAPPAAPCGERLVGTLAGRWRPHSADVAFAALLFLGATLLLVQMRGLSFFQDEWDFILLRRGGSAHVLLTPHNQHLSLVPILGYKALLAIFGAGSYAPFKALAALDLVLVALAVGVVCRSWWGAWWGLMPVALIVTLGAGGWTWLWPFCVGETLATVAGIAALVTVGRGGRRGDGLACAALVFSLATGSQGIGALAGAAVMIALGRDRWRRAWVVALPAVLYGLWYLDYGRKASGAELRLWTHIPDYVWRSLSATISGVTGLSQLHSPASGVVDPYYGKPLAIALLVVVAVALRRGWRPPCIVWGVTATLLVLWIAACLNNGGGARPPNVGRYLPVNAAFLLIGVCASVPRPRLSRTGWAAACAVLAVVCVTNAAQYSASRGTFRTASVSSRALLGGLLLTRGLVDLAFVPGWGPPAYVDFVQAGPYFRAVDSFGSNADSAAALQRAPEAARGLTDGVMARAEQVGLPPPVQTAHGTTPPALLSGSAQARDGCLVLGADRVAVTSPAGGIRLDAPPGTGVTVALARFASAFTVGLGQVAPGGSAAIRLPADRAPRTPWRLQLSGAGTRVCGLGASYGARGFIMSVSPVDGGSGIPPNAKVVATFSEAMDRTSTSRAFSLARASDRKPVAGSVAFFGNHTPFFVPNSPLAQATRYTASISQAAMDQAGNHPAALTTWSFTTSR